jgi:Tfp pilus assembly protein PilO
MATETPQHRWHQTLPAWLAVVITVFVQTVAVSIWLGAIRGDLDKVIETNSKQDAALEAVRAETQRQQVGAATVSAQLQSLRESLAELKEAQRETNALLRQLSSEGIKP